MTEELFARQFFISIVKFGRSNEQKIKKALLLLLSVCICNMSPLLFGGKQSFTKNYSSSPKTQKIPGKFHWWMASIYIKPKPDKAQCTTFSLEERSLLLSQTTSDVEV